MDFELMLKLIKILINIFTNHKTNFDSNSEKLIKKMNKNIKLSSDNKKALEEYKLTTIEECNIHIINQTKHCFK